MQRLHAFMQTTNAPPWEVVTDDEIPEMLDLPVWTRTRGHSGERAELFDPVFFFTTYRFDGQLEAIRNRVAAAHPAFDAERLWSCFFGRKDNRYLIAHTKSGNVDFLETLPHNGKTIMCYSLSAQTQSTQLEKGAATTRERIDAARKCQEWGMHVRFKFKPIIPVKGWRDEARDMIREVFDKTRPDNLSMTVMMWMDFDAMAGMEPGTYTCGCGPNALPGRRTLATNAWKIAERKVRPAWL